MKLTVTTVPFHDLTSSPSSELKLGDSNKILCTLKSRPISTLLWKINDKLVLNDPKAFSIVSKTVGLFTNSTFVVINPISFQANTKVTCLVNGKPISRSILINSDFVKVNKHQYKFDFSSTVNGTERFCDKYNGAKESIYNDECEITAAEIQPLPPQRYECIGTEISFNITDHTKSSSQFKLVVTLTSSSTSSKTIYTNSTNFQLTDLEPQASYQIKMSYKPKYWTDSVELVKNFDTRVSLFEPIVITEAFLKEDSCEVEYRLASTTLEDQVNLILVRIFEVNISSSFTKRIQKKYKYLENNGTFMFATSGDDFEYEFQVSLSSCSGVVGQWSEPFVCIKKPGSGRNLYYLLLLLIIPIIFLLTRRFILDLLKKRSESIKEKTDEIESTNKVLSSVDDKKIKKKKKKKKRKNKRKKHKQKVKGKTSGEETNKV